MAILTNKQAISKIYRLAKTLAEFAEGKIASTKTQIEFYVNDCKTGDILYISKWDGQVMSIKPIFESAYIKIKIFIIENDKYIIDVK